MWDEQRSFWLKEIATATLCSLKWKIRRTIESRSLAAVKLPSGRPMEQVRWLRIWMNPSAAADAVESRINQRQYSEPCDVGKSEIIPVTGFWTPALLGRWLHPPDGATVIVPTSPCCWLVHWQKTSNCALNSEPSIHRVICPLLSSASASAAKKIESSSGRITWRRCRWWNNRPVLSCVRTLDPCSPLQFSRRSILLSTRMRSLRSCQLVPLRLMLQIACRWLSPVTL